MEPTYLYSAVDCPAIPESPAAILISTGGASTPISQSAESLLAGDTPLAGAGKLNRNFGRLDNLGRYGGGHAGAIWWGLELTDRSPPAAEVVVTAGQAGIDSGTELAADTPVPLTDGIRSRTWLSRGGTLSAVTIDSAAPLEPPDAGDWTYLGLADVNGAALRSVDRSGVLTVYRGGLVYRRTADSGAPTDTPPSSLRFLSRTAGGLYLWDGEQYALLDADAALAASLTDLTELTERLDWQECAFRQLLFVVATLLKPGNVLVTDDLQREFVRAAREARR